MSQYSWINRNVQRLLPNMQPFLKGDNRLQALDEEMEYMFSTWFDVGQGAKANLRVDGELPV